MVHDSKHTHTVIQQVTLLCYTTPFLPTPDTPVPDMNAALTEVLLKACVSPVLLADRFALEHTMLVAILHLNVGSEVGRQSTLSCKVNVLCLQ